MSIFDIIEKPTLLLDETVARKNIEKIGLKAQAQGVRFRPHFKTHQSAEIGEWFRTIGITGITVSSIDMAQYFARHGWNDITIAFPFNLRQIAAVNILAEQIQLGLLVESFESVQFLQSHLKHPVDVWIKVDTGSGRTGFLWENLDAVFQLVNLIRQSTKTNLRGLLTHAGHTYHAQNPEEICNIYDQSVDRINQLKTALNAAGHNAIEVSVGDTPGCSVCADLGNVDEIRPGNFIFYDAQQLKAGSCLADDIAVAVACPVVAKHPERNELIIYGGAIHLSKDYLLLGDQKAFGLVALPDQNRWGHPLKNAFVRGLSQEHGVIRMAAADLQQIKIGDLICIIPAHSCLTVQLLRSYLTLEGNQIHTLND